MRTWLLLLGGLIVWAANFLAIYVAVSIWPGTVLARVLALLLSAAGLAAAAFVIIRLRRWRGDQLTQWIGGVSAAGCALAALAMVYHGLTAVLA